MRTVRAMALVALATLVSACGVFGTEPADTFEERYAYAVSTITAVRDTAREALQAGDISVDKAQDVLKASDSARTLADSALAVKNAGRDDEANQTLLRALTLIEQLQEILDGS